MKKYGWVKFLNLIISITIFTILIVLRYFLKIEWNDNILLRFTLLIMILLLFVVGLWVLLTLSWIILDPVFKHKEIKKKQMQVEQGMLLFCEPIGELLFSDGWYKIESISLFEESYRITIRFQADSKEDHLSVEQEKSYSEFFSMYERCCTELEKQLEEQEYADIFEPAEIIFAKNGDYKMLASDTTSDDSNVEFVVTFNPIEITLEEIDY